MPTIDIMGETASIDLLKTKAGIDSASPSGYQILAVMRCQLFVPTQSFRLFLSFKGLDASFLAHY